jgi:hypothetical protein
VASILKIALDLWRRLNGLISSPTIVTLCSRNLFDIMDCYNQLPISKGPIPPLDCDLLGHQNAGADPLSCLEFVTNIDNLRAAVSLLKKQSLAQGSISCFQDLLPGV